MSDPYRAMVEFGQLLWWVAGLSVLLLVACGVARLMDRRGL